MSDRGRIRPARQPLRDRAGNFGWNERSDQKTISDPNSRFIGVKAESFYSFPTTVVAEPRRRSTRHKSGILA
jgi:hypothetical protein